MRKLKYGILLGIFVAMGSMTTIHAATVASNKSSLATVSDAGSTDEEGEIEVSTMEELSRFVSNEEELREAVAYGGVIELNQDILLTKTLNLGSVKIIGHDHKLYTGEFSGIDNLIELKGGELKNLTIETNYEKCAIHGKGKIENVKLISKVEAENVGIGGEHQGLTVLNSTIEGYKTGIEINKYYGHSYDIRINDTTITRGAYSVDGSIGFKDRLDSRRDSSEYRDSVLDNVTISGYGIAVDGARKVEGGVFKNNNIGLKEVYDINRAKVEKNVVGIEVAANFTNVNVSDNKTGIIIGRIGNDFEKSVTGLVSNNEVGIIIEEYSYKNLSYDGLNIRDNTQYDIYSERDIQINKDNLVKYNLEWKDFDKDGTSTLRKAYAMVGKGDEFTITKYSNEYSRIKAVKVNNIELAKDKIQTTKDGEGYIHKITIPANADKRVEIKYEYNTLLVHDEAELRNAIQNANGETIYLKSDIALNNTLDIASLSLVNIDGGGHKLYTTNNNNLETLIHIPNAINVKLSNLNIVDTRNSIGIPETKAIVVDGNLELLNTNIRNFTKAVVVNSTGTYNKISGEVLDGTNIRQGSDNDTTTNTTDNNTAGGSGGGGSRGGSGGGGSRGGSGGGGSRGGSGGGGGSRGAGAGVGIAKTGLSQTQATLPTIASTLPSINTGKWEKVNQKWSLKKADGQYARNQWANIASKWYFLDKDGYILTGLNNINNNTYNFAADGSMSLGWVNINYKWYYFEPSSGAMKKGWLLYNNNWYYLKADGTMAVNEKTADGYQVNNLGIWVR